MKKLITIMASMATCLLFGDGFTNSGTSFEDYAPGGKTIADLTEFGDDGKDTGSYRYWFYEGDKNVAIGAITNGTPDAPSRPTQFGNTNTNYLDLTASDATNVFYRAINNVAGKSSVASLDGESIGNGLYLDTLVKFTPTESTNDFTLASGDKLAITYCEETEGDGALLSNIVVCAGYVANGVATEKTYVMEIPEDLKASFVATNWHRLTVRAIEVGYAAAPVGFVIYLDGCPDPLTYAVGEAAGDSTYTDALAGNSIVASYLYNTEKHALIPSAVNTGTAKTTLSAVGFKGNGCVDDISFTATQPTFIQEGTTVTIAWDDNVASYTVATNGTTMVDGETVSGEGSASLFIANGTTTITVTATYDDGYTNGVWTASVGTLSNGVWTDFESGATLTINSMFPLFQVGETQYGTFGAALTAAVAAGTEVAPATVKLLADVSETIAFTEGFIVLDLNGRTLHAGTGAKFVVANSGASLTIVDTATGGVVEAGTTGSVRVYGDTAFTTIEAGTYDGTIVITGQDEVQPEDVLVVKGGKFYDEDYESDPSEGFYLASFVDTTTYEISGPDANFYFTVSESTPEPPAPTVVQIPTAALNLVYTGNQQTGVAAGEGYTLTGNIATNAGNYTATATLEPGYVWSDTTTAAKSIDWSIAADSNATVVVTLESEIAEYTAQLEFPTATATIGENAVAGTPVWNPATITEPAAGATNTYTVTFTVTTANYAGSFGTAEFKVWKAAESGYPSYIPTEDAEVKAAYDTWAAKYGADAGGAYEDAFLLNIAPDAADQTLEPASITIVDGKIVIEANKDLDAVNGKVYIKTAATLSGLESATWTEATLDKDGAIEMTPNATGAFFKIKVDF